MGQTKELGAMARVKQVGEEEGVETLVELRILEAVFGHLEKYNNKQKA